MPVNHYFQDGNGIGNTAEKRLYEDLIIEQLKIYGQDVFYLPRKIANKDTVFGEDPASSFDDSYIIEMYVDNTDGYMGEQEIIKKFGLELRDDIVFTLSKLRWEIHPDINFFFNNTIILKIDRIGKYILINTSNKNTLIFYNKADKSKITKFKRKGIHLIKSRIDRNNRFDIKLILKKLHNYGCRNLLIEGGDKLTNSLIKNKIFNKFYLYKSPKNLSKNFEYLKFSSQNILNQKYKTKINLNLNLRKDRITLYS